MKIEGHQKATQLILPEKKFALSSNCEEDVKISPPYILNSKDTGLSVKVTENVPVSPKEEQKLPEVSDTIEIPSRAASIALAKAAAHNQEAIKEQVEEASHYVRVTSIAVDERVANLHKKLNAALEKTLLNVGEVKDTFRDVVEGAGGLSTDLKGEVTALVNQIAEKLIEAMQLTQRDSSQYRCDDLETTENELFDGSKVGAGDPSRG